MQKINNLTLQISKRNLGKILKKHKKNVLAQGENIHVASLKVKIVTYQD